MAETRRLFKHLLREKRMILIGLAGTLGMGIAEVLTGGLLKVLLDLVPDFSEAFTSGGTLPIDVRLPLKALGRKKVDLFYTELSGEDAVMQGIVVFCLVFLGIYVFRELCRYTRDTSLDSAVQRVMRNFKQAVFNKVLRLPMAFFDRTPTGELISRITYDVARLEGVVLMIVELLRAGVALLLFIPVLFYINWPIACFAVLYYPLAFWFMRILNRRIGTIGRAASENVADYTTFLEDRVNGISSIRAFKYEASENIKFKTLVNHNLKLNLLLIRLKHILKPMSDLQGMVGICLMVILFALFARKGWASDSLGSAASFLYLASQAYKPVKKVAQSMAELHITLASTDKIFRLLDEIPCPTVLETDPDESPTIHTIEFREVSFGYLPGQTILNKVSFKVNAGETLALVGSSGCGKTTLTRLLMGFYQPVSGEILINGKRMTPAVAAQFRSRMAGVSGDLRLLDASVAENLAPKEELPEEYTQLLQRTSTNLNSEIASDAAHVSAGQRTVLKFIRALLRQPDLLIMDEAFLTLDAETEALVKNLIPQECIKIVVSTNIDEAQGSGHTVYLPHAFRA